VVGHSFDVGTDLRPYVSRAMPEVMELIAGFVRRRGEGGSAATPA